MLVLGKVAENHEQAVLKLKELISSGKAFDKFKEFVSAQGGDVNSIEHTEELPTTEHKRIYYSKEEGFLSDLNALDVGLASVKLGAGRETKDSAIDFGAGIRLLKKIGDFVENGDPLAELYSNDESSFNKAEELLNLAYKFTEKKPLEKPLILKTVR